MRIIALSLLKCRSPPILNGGGGGEWKKCPLSNAFTYTSTKKVFIHPYLCSIPTLIRSSVGGAGAGSRAKEKSSSNSSELG